MRKALPVNVTESDRNQLEAWRRSRTLPVRQVERARIVLRAAQPDNPSNQNLAAELACDRHTIGQWRERFVATGLPGLQDASRSGRPRSFSPRRTPARRHAGQ